MDIGFKQKKEINKYKHKKIKEKREEKQGKDEVKKVTRINMTIKTKEGWRRKRFVCYRLVNDHPYITLL